MAFSPNILFFRSGSFVAPINLYAKDFLVPEFFGDDYGAYQVSFTGRTATPTGCCGTIRFTRYPDPVDGRGFGGYLTPWSFFGNADTTFAVGTNEAKICINGGCIRYLSELLVSTTVDWVVYKFM